MEANLIYSIDFDKHSVCVELFSKKFAKIYPILKFKYNKIEYSIFHNRLFSLISIRIMFLICLICFIIVIVYYH